MEKVMVQKYGGTSVGTIERIQKVVQRVIRAKEEGYQVVVVVSAMGETTDDLLAKARSVNPEPDSRELDMLLATGEQVSIALLAMALRAAGQDVISLTGFQCEIITDGRHRSASIEEIRTQRLVKELAQNRIVIVAGFQGITRAGEITTLGRGGSDITAVALAAALHAGLCEIYTDVDGVYTADPRIVKEAQLLSNISYDEMLEMASLGANVLHPRSVEVAKKFNLPLVVKSSFTGNPGTKIVEVDEVENPLVKGVALDKEIIKISVINMPGKLDRAYKLFATLTAENIKIDMVTQHLNQQNQMDLVFTIKAEDLLQAAKICEKAARQIGAESVIITTTVAKVSIVGIGIGRSPLIVSKVFETLYARGNEFQLVSTAENKVSCLVDLNSGEEVLQHLHEQFHPQAYTYDTNRIAI